jgi:hypothetical protein
LNKGEVAELCVATIAGVGGGVKSALGTESVEVAINAAGNRAREATKVVFNLIMVFLSIKKLWIVALVALFCKNNPYIQANNPQPN